MNGTITSNGKRKLAGILSQLRYRYVFGGSLAILLAVLTLLQALNAYSISYQLFRGIAEVNSTSVDASERALQYLAQASQASADYALLTSDTPLYEQAQNNIFRSFSHFRDEMAILGGNLQSDEERTAYTVADTFTYSRFWRHVSNLVAQRSNDAVARREFLDADNHVRNWITPALEELENLNFEQMVQAGENAQTIIISQVILFAIPALLLVILLVDISLELRSKLRRYITPGIDGALALAILLPIFILIQLLGTPAQLSTMIQSAYLSVSASSRVLVDANLANRAESSMLLDIERGDSWNQRFDKAVQRVELRICGQTDCMSSFFTYGTDDIKPAVVENARAITADDSKSIDGIIPLVANVSFEGEANALEDARLAFVDFLAVNQELRTLIQNNEIESAILINTTTDAASSQEAFNRFESSINELSQINRTVFDEIWTAQSSSLRNNQVLLGLGGYALILILLLVGIWHRYREL